MIALVTVNYNDADTTERFIKQIVSYINIEHIILVDNCSTDDSYKRLLHLKNGKTDVIRAEKNGGYASGNNLGVEFALKHYNPKYIVISNPDVKFDNNMLRKLVETADKIERLGIITCKMNCVSGINLPIAWKLPSYKNCLLEQLIILKKLLGYNYEYDKTHYFPQLTQVDVIPGSFFLMSAEAFKSINGFDEDTFLYYEENILAYKLKKHGFCNYILTTEEFIHLHSVSINKNISSVKKRLQLNFESRLIYCEKYLKIGSGKKLLLKIIFKIGISNYMIALRILKKQGKG